MNSGWVKIHRKLWDNPRSKDPAWVSIWLYLVTNATHAPRDTIFEGNRITLQPGQLITGRNAIEAVTGVNASKVQRILKTMKIEQQIEQQTSNASRLVTILNWASYQEGEQQSEHQVNIERTSSEHRVNTNKNVKNVKNVENGKKNTPLSPLNGKSQSRVSQRVLPDCPHLQKLSLAYSPTMKGKVSQDALRRYSDLEPDPEDINIIADYVTAYRSHPNKEAHEVLKYCSRTLEVCLGSKYEAQLQRAHEWKNRRKQVDDPDYYDCGDKF